jgi:hypothetical protein
MFTFNLSSQRTISTFLLTEKAKFIALCKQTQKERREQIHLWVFRKRFSEPAVSSVIEIISNANFQSFSSPDHIRFSAP